MVALGSIKGWRPADGPVTTWTASPAAREAVENARRSDLIPSYQRIRHLRAAYDAKAQGMQLPRLMVVAWEIPGVCDIAAMTAAINAHVRRHDAYHDWFEFEDGAIVRRMIDNPEVIDLVPTDFGPMDTEQIRTHALTTTPETLHWDCFTFRIVQRHTHDYVRHGTTTLFAALEIATGQVTGLCQDRHRHQEFLRFLKHLASAYPDQQLHLVMDNYAAHKRVEIRTWLAANPRIHVHFTPTSASWLNLVEVWFGIIERQAIHRGTFANVRDLTTAIKRFIAGWNNRAHPFVWTKTADQILKKADRQTTLNTAH
jgi:transposase